MSLHPTERSVQVRGRAVEIGRETYQSGDNPVGDGGSTTDAASGRKPDADLQVRFHGRTDTGDLAVRSPVRDIQPGDAVSATQTEVSIETPDANHTVDIWVNYESEMETLNDDPDDSAAFNNFHDAPDFSESAVTKCVPPGGSLTDAGVTSVIESTPANVQAAAGGTIEGTTSTAGVNDDGNECETDSADNTVYHYSYLRYRPVAHSTDPSVSVPELSGANATHSGVLKDGETSQWYTVAEQIDADEMTFDVSLASSDEAHLGRVGLEWRYEYVQT